VFVGLILAAGTASCGSGGSPSGPPAGPPPLLGTVEVDPPSGPVGTVFMLAAHGLRVGDAVAFEITFPGQGKAFPGLALSVPDGGTVTTTYRATTANQPGDYLVHVTGPPGRVAEGRFTILTGAPLRGHAGPAGTSTSRSASATTKPMGSTKPAPATTSTTRSRPSSTTTLPAATTTTATGATTTSVASPRQEAPAP
jgi:hypothetical protein